VPETIVVLMSSYGSLLLAWMNDRVGGHVGTSASTGGFS
jgi:hypothetical protein